MKICIAEDDPTTRVMLDALLKKWGYIVVSVEDGQQALETLGTEDSPKLVLLDWNMPLIDGLELTRRLRKLETILPPYIIMLTSRGEKESIILGLNAGANDYIPKPYDVDVLRARVNVGRRMIELQTSLIETREALINEANHDSLTGILNRRAILETLAKEISRSSREKSMLTIGILDIDWFKEINDTRGHAAGDVALCAIVERIQEGLRTYDYLGRIGGDEFLIITPGGDRSSIPTLYERLRDSVADNPVPAGGAGLPITVSIGLASCEGYGDADEMMASADAALYRAKAAGRNRVEQD